MSFSMSNLGHMIHSFNVLSNFKHIHIISPTEYIFQSVCSMHCSCILCIQPLHTVAAALNAFDNVLLRNIMESKDWSITVYNHPLPRTQDTQVHS